MLVYFFGGLGVIANMLIYWQKNGQRLLIFKLISDVIWAIHYLLLNAHAAATIAVIGIFREFVFYNKGKKWAKSKLWLVFFVALSIVLALITQKSIYAFLPATASVLSVICFWQKNPALSRIMVYPISLCMLIYDLTCQSYAGIVNEAFTMLSTTFALIHLTKLKENKHENK